MKKLAEVHAEGASLPFEISLAKLTGQPVIDIHGYITRNFGESTFQLTRVVFADGTQIQVEGEHDLPYLCPSEPVPGLDRPTMDALHEEQEVAARIR